MSSARSTERESFPEIDSFNHPLCLVPIDLPKGRLFLTTAPGFRGMFWFDGGPCKFVRDMYFDVEHLRQHGVSRLVTLMSGDEILDAEMGGLESTLAMRNVSWTHLPYSSTADGKAFFLRELSRLADEIRFDLEAGGFVAIHGDDFWHEGLCDQIPTLMVYLRRPPGFE